MRKISSKDFVHEDKNVDGVLVVMVVVAMVVEVTMLPTWRQQGTEHLAKYVEHV